jgi:hypothetical protein
MRCSSERESKRERARERDAIYRETETEGQSDIDWCVHGWVGAGGVPGVASRPLQQVGGVCVSLRERERESERARASERARDERQRERQGQESGKRAGEREREVEAGRQGGRERGKASVCVCT